MEHTQRSGPPGPADGSPSLREEPREWLLAYGLYVGAAVVAGVVALAVVSLVLVLVAALLSMPMGSPPESGSADGGAGPNPIADLGELLFDGGILVTVGLGLLLVVHGVVELHTAATAGRDLDLGEPTDLAYVGVRAAQTVGAVAFAGTVATGFVLARASVIPREPGQTVGFLIVGGGVTMLAAIVVHALGRGVRVVADGW